MILHNRPLLLPVRILATHLYAARGRPVKQVLVEWSHSPSDDATWENLAEFCKLYQLLDLEDKVNFEDEGSVSHVDIGLDSVGIKKLIEGWVAKGKVDIEEAKSNQVEAQIGSATESLAKAQGEEDLAEKRIRVSSRKTKTPAWMIDFV